MQGLRNRDIFRFCAIPQIMSIGTLALLYNNGKVFEGKPQGRSSLELSVTHMGNVCTSCSNPCQAPGGRVQSMQVQVFQYMFRQQGMYVACPSSRLEGCH